MDVANNGDNASLGESGQTEMTMPTNMGNHPVTNCLESSGGDGANLTGGSKSRLRVGDDSRITAGDRSELFGGKRSQITAGDFSTLMGEEDSILTAGVHSILVGGDRSTLAMLWRDSDDKFRLIVAVVGKRGISPRVAYKISDKGRFARA